MKHPLQVLIDEYQSKGMTEAVLLEEAAKLPVQTMKVRIGLNLQLYKTVEVPVSILAEAAIDESGDVYNDAISALLPMIDATGAWDDFQVNDEEHTWVDDDGREVER